MTLIAIDGIDGSGKSTLTAGLKARMPECDIIPEFSSTDIGVFLKVQILKSPHFIAKSELAQSLLFLSEYADRIETMCTDPSNPNILQILERGWLSKYSYQVCVLERRFRTDEARQLVSSILNLLPQPTATILLRVSDDVLKGRVAERTAASNSDFLDFLHRADQLMLGVVSSGYPAMVLDTSHLTPAEVVDAAVHFIRSIKLNLTT